MSEIHPPRIEYFDLAAQTNTDRDGRVRPVDRMYVKPWGLYMARATEVPRLPVMESWLIPALSLRASIFHYQPRAEHDQDFYLDIGEFGPVGPQLWRAEDHYLDILVHTGRSSRLIDIDELIAANTAGLLDLPKTIAAVNRAMHVIDGIASHGHDFEQWAAAAGVPLSWR